ncbi:MAG: pentapeptide repeat-containing protein [Planctomycetales bacterium]|nr:pentapeptide repeat-containing protein [Planctomycetales bacterium]
MSTKELKSRWSDDLLESVFDHLEKGLAYSPFGNTDDERLDLRGVRLAYLVRDVELKNADMSFCEEGRGQIAGWKMSNVLLNNSRLTSNIHGHFHNCSFHRANMNGAWLDGVFDQCAFNLAKMRAASAEDTTFDQCSFLGSDLRKAHLCDCRFIKCDWEDVHLGDGSFSESRFLNGFPSDIGNTIMTKVTHG